MTLSPREPVNYYWDETIGMKSIFRMTFGYNLTVFKSLIGHYKLTILNLIQNDLAFSVALEQLKRLLTKRYCNNDVECGE